jgi:hypothetical protein
MAYEPYSRVDFGPARSGLKTVGYTLIQNGRPIGPRITTGIADLGRGHYGAAIRFPANFRGQLVWDTGGPSPQRVRFSVSPEDGSQPDTRVCESPAPPARPTAAEPRPRVVPPPDPVRPAPTCTVPAAVPATERVEGLAVPGRLKAIVLRAGQRPQVEWTMLDADCGPIDLTPCMAGELVLGTLRVTPDCFNYYIDFPAASPTPATGLMVAEVSPAQLGGPGIYQAEMGVMAPDGDYIAYTNRFLLVVESGLFGYQAENGPPTLAEIRLDLRDSSPLENELLDDSLAFSNAELAVALRDVVDYWNEALPRLIQARYTTQNFPFRYWWKQGAKARLFRIAAEGHRRNQVDYQAGGVTYDEHGQKAQMYDQAADRLWDEFKQWAQGMKISINLDDGWLDFTSTYSRI